MSISYCPNCYTNELLNYYPFLENVNIYTADDKDFDILGLSDALAATDRKGVIIVRRNLPWAIFRHSLFHECEHFLHSYNTPEYLVDIEARKKDGFNYKMNIYGLESEVKLNNKSGFKYEVNFENKTDKLPAYLV